MTPRQKRPVEVESGDPTAPSVLGRRAALRALGATLGCGVAVATTSEVAVAAPAAARPARPAEPRVADIQDLIAPLEEGSLIGRWTVTTLLPFADGAVGVVMTDQAGARFQLDICARDDSEQAPTPPGRTERFDVFLSNEGQGWTASFEDHGLAAMAVADVIRNNEVRLEASAFLTLRRRLATSGHRVQRRV